jgi:hypothetical protein
MDYCWLIVYGRFLSSRTIAAPTKTIAMITPIMAGRKFWSAIEVGCCVGALVGVASAPTVRYVEEPDGPYEFEPGKVAMIW